MAHMAKDMFGFASAATLAKKVDGGKLTPNHRKKLVAMVEQMRRTQDQLRAGLQP